MFSVVIHFFIVSVHCIFFTFNCLPELIVELCIGFNASWVWFPWNEAAMTFSDMCSNASVASVPPF